MRFGVTFTLAAALLAGPGVPAEAQDRSKPDGSRVPGRGPGVVFDTLDRNPALQEELKLTQEQLGKLRDAMQPIREKRREMLKDFNLAALTAFAFSPDGKNLAVGCADGSVWIWPWTAAP